MLDEIILQDCFTLPLFFILTFDLNLIFLKFIQAVDNFSLRHFLVDITIDNTYVYIISLIKRRKYLSFLL